MLGRWHDLSRTARLLWSALALLLLIGCASPAATGGGASPPKTTATVAPTAVPSANAPSSEPTSTTAAPPSCTLAAPAAVTAVATGLTVNGGGSLGHAVVIEVPIGKRSATGWPTLLLAAQIQGEGMTPDVIGVWATGDAGAGPIFAINPFAREFSDWGSAAQPGSKAADNRDLIASYDEVGAVHDCAA